MKSIHSSAKAANRKRKFLFSAMSALIFFLILFIVYFLAYRYYVTTLYGYTEVHSREYIEPMFPKFTSEQIVNLGWAHSHNGERSPLTNRYPRSSYLNFEFDKADSVIRVGIFGGSFTEGTESGYGLDFPSLLEDRLKAGGYDRVQVINFGVGSYGMHQSYLMYEYLGSQYNLDVVVMNPTSGHRTRDNRFIYSNNYTGVHARYILHEGKLKRIDVKGDSRLEAAKEYHRFFQDTRYLNYDMRTPNFMEVVFQDYNPYYYTGETSVETTDPEIFETYRLIFDSLASQVKQVIVISNDEDFYQLHDRVKHDNILFYKPAPVESWSYSLYKAPCTHYSAFGNQFRADELLNVLTESNDSLLYLVFEPVINIYHKAERDLSAHDSLFIQIENFRYRSLYSKSGMDVFEFCNDQIDVSDLNAKCLLLLPSASGDITFLPLKIYPENGEDVRIKVGSKQVELKNLTQLNPYVFTINENVDIKTWDRDFVVIRTQNEEYFNLHEAGKSSGAAQMILRNGNKEEVFPLFQWRLKKVAFQPDYAGNLSFELRKR